MNRFVIFLASCVLFMNPATPGIPRPIRKIRRATSSRRSTRFAGPLRIPGGILGQVHRKSVVRDSDGPQMSGI